MATSATDTGRRAGVARAVPAADNALSSRIAEIPGRRATVGLAVGVVHNGRYVSLAGHGLADVASSTPVTEDTVFRIGSITKTFTAIALLQLWEKGLVDLDAPANHYLTGFQLLSPDDSWLPVTVRHLLTHTAGIPDVLRVRDLLHPSWGPFEGRPPVWSVEIGEPLPSLAEYYQGGIRIVTEPGTVFAYSNHGFATLGQIVEEVTGVPLDRYFREHIFGPLGMAHTDVVRSDRVQSRLATGYVLGRRGPEPVPDREWLGRAGGGVYSSSRDLARYASALLRGGANEHGSILEPATLATMFERHYSPDPRLVAMGLGFFCYHIAGHRIVGHDGILPGFNSSLLIAPDDEVAVFGLTNGSRGAMVWLPIEMENLFNRLLGFPSQKVRTGVPHHPELWSQLCGLYRLSPVGDLRGRLVMGLGARVLVHRGRLVMRLLTPMPTLYQGFPLQPDDEDDPYVFRVDLSRFGMPPVRLVFDRDAGPGNRAIHTDLGGQPISLYERPAFSPSSWAPARSSEKPRT